MWPGPRPTCIPSFILISPTVWPQYTNVTDRTGQDRQADRQWSNRIGQTVLQMVRKNQNATKLRIHRTFPIPIYGPTVFFSELCKGSHGIDASCRAATLQALSDLLSDLRILFKNAVVLFKFVKEAQ